MVTLSSCMSIQRNVVVVKDGQSCLRGFSWYVIIGDASAGDHRGGLWQRAQDIPSGLLCVHRIGERSASGVMSLVLAAIVSLVPLLLLPAPLLLLPLFLRSPRALVELRSHGLRGVAHVTRAPLFNVRTSDLLLEAV